MFLDKSFIFVLLSYIFHCYFVMDYGYGWNNSTLKFKDDGEMVAKRFVR